MTAIPDLSGNGGGIVLSNPRRGTVLRKARQELDDMALNVLKFDADDSGREDSAPAFNRAAQVAAGRPIYAPGGVYRLDTPIEYITSSTATFTPGIKIIGDGSGETVFDCRVANGAQVRVGTDAVGIAQFQRNILFRGMTFTGEFGNPLNADGMKFDHAYNVQLDDVYIQRFTRDGIVVPIIEGDTDGSNNMLLRMSRIDRCLRWGFHADALGANNEFSFLTLEDSSITACGTTSVASPPDSGGMKWKGQLASLIRSYISECHNVGLYIMGTGGGLPLGMTLKSFTLENNRGVPLLCTGIDGLWIDGLDLRNSDSFLATSGVMLNATDAAIRGVDIKNAVIIATDGNNPYTAFDAAGTLGGSVSIDEVVWRDFDATGQTRYSNNLYLFSEPKIGDNGKERYASARTLRTVITTNNPSYTPDIMNYEVHSLSLGVGASGTLTIAAPSTYSSASTTREGREMTLIISNDSGVTLNLAYNGSFVVNSAPATIATGVRKSAKFVFDRFLGMVQVGAWS